MERAVDETQAALIAAQPGSPVEKKLFRRGDRLVSLAINEGKDHKGGTVEHQIIVEVGEHTIAERMAVAATFQKWDARKKGGGGLKRVDPPKDLVKTLIGRGYGLKLPLLVGVVNCPQMAADGRIVDQPGYDAGTGIFFDPRGAKFPAIVANPRQADAEMATRSSAAALSHVRFSERKGSRGRDVAGPDQAGEDRHGDGATARLRRANGRLGQVDDRRYRQHPRHRRAGRCVRARGLRWRSSKSGFRCN